MISSAIHLNKVIIIIIIIFVIIIIIIIIIVIIIIIRKTNVQENDLEIEKGLAGLI